jgi:hypothetical protein
MNEYKGKSNLKEALKKLVNENFYSKQKQMLKEEKKKEFNDEIFEKDYKGFIDFEIQEESKYNSGYRIKTEYRKRKTAVPYIEECKIVIITPPQKKFK